MTATKRKHTDDPPVQRLPRQKKLKPLPDTVQLITLAEYVSHLKASRNTPLPHKLGLDETAGEMGAWEWVTRMCRSKRLTATYEYTKDGSLRKSRLGLFDLSLS